MYRNFKPSAFAARVLLITLLLLIGTAAAETRPNRVAIIPFAVHADRDMTFLRDGITDMLTSRLSWDKTVQVLGREQTAAAVKGATGPMNEIQAQIIGAKLEADYVLFGSLTIFADSVSIDAKLVDVSGAKPTMAFYNQAQGLGQVIPQINRFATDINAKVFGRGTPPPVALQPAAPGPAAAGAPAGAAAGALASQQTPTSQMPVADNRAHPEKLAEGDFPAEGGTSPLGGSPFGNTAATTPNAPIGSAFVEPEIAEVQATFWKSRTMKIRLIGIALGDVDKDGQVETVMADTHSVDVYRMVNSVFQRAYPAVDMGSRHVVGIDVADINGNGYPEIYISALNARLSMAESVVYEINGDRFAPLVNKIGYFFRVVNTPLRGTVLLGQAIKPFGDPWEMPIEEMAWVGSELKPQTRLLPGGTASVLGTAVNDIQNNGSEDTAVVFSRLDDLEVVSIAGQTLWKSAEKYGGGELYFLKQQETPTEENRQWLPVRVLATDLDGNGSVDVISIKNKDLLDRALERQRKFTEGVVTGLSWSSGQLISAWKSRRITGQISDIAVGDIDNDGRPELVLSVVTGQGQIIGTNPSSSVVAYDLK